MMPREIACGLRGAIDEAKICGQKRPDITRRVQLFRLGRTGDLRDVARAVAVIRAPAVPDLVVEHAHRAGGSAPVERLGEDWVRIMKMR